MINVIGLGYIGLPTALMMASHGVEVIGQQPCHWCRQPRDWRKSDGKSFGIINKNIHQSCNLFGFE